jgi:hypothetical protein
VHGSRSHPDVLLLRVLNGPISDLPRERLMYALLGVLVLAFLAFLALAGGEPPEYNPGDWE